MWALRILNGPQAGQIYELKSGKNKIGRVPSVDFQLQSAGVSKEHFEIQVFGDKIIISDLKSSNGTFLNGIRIQQAILKSGDLIGVHDLMLEVVAIAQVAVDLQNQYSPQPNPLRVANQAASYSSNSSAPMPEPQQVSNVELSSKVKNFLDSAVMPSLYRLIEVFDLKQILIGFAVLFIFVVTVLSVFPMQQMTSESIEIESRRRALTVARSLAYANEKSLRTGDFSSFSTDSVLREDGIEDVYVVSREGTLLAPAERAGGTPKQAGFIKTIRGQSREYSEKISSDQVAAAYPILVFDADLQQNVAKAYAVVVFNVGSLHFDDGRTFSLFIQMLALASLIGAIAFYLLSKVIEYPLNALTADLDYALKDGRDHVNANAKFPALQNLVITINSLLARNLNASHNGSSANLLSRDQEFSSLVQLIGYPAVLMNKELKIITCNDGFEKMLGQSRFQIMNQSLHSLPDQALQKNIVGLTQQAHQQMAQVFSDQLEMSGHQVKLNCQALMGGSGHAEYFLITITPIDGLEGVA